MSLYFALLTVENNKNKKSVKFQGDMLNFYDFIQVFVFTRNHHLNLKMFGSKGCHCKVPCTLFTMFTYLLGWMDDLRFYILFNRISVISVVLLFYVHCKHLRSCRDGQLP